MTECLDRECQKDVHEMRVDMYGHNPGEGLKWCVSFLKQEVGKKVSTKFLICLFIIIAIPVSTYAWVMSTDHESRIQSLEKRQAILEKIPVIVEKTEKIPVIIEKTDEILKILKKP